MGKAVFKVVNMDRKVVNIERLSVIKDLQLDPARGSQNIQVYPVLKLIKTVLLYFKRGLSKTSNYIPFETRQKPPTVFHERRLKIIQPHAQCGSLKSNCLYSTPETAKLVLSPVHNNGRPSPQTLFLSSDVYDSCT